MATANSPGVPTTPTPASSHRQGRNARFRTGVRPALLLALFAGLVASTYRASASDAPSQAAAIAGHLERYAAARERWLQGTNDPGAIIEFSRLSLLAADRAKSGGERASMADQAVRACRHLAAIEPTNAAAYYYLALNLGRMAQSRPLSGLSIVKQMENLFLKSIALDEKLDHAGPDRALGILYLEAPGWPTSIGSRPKARKHLTRSLELDPDYPDNALCLAEAAVRWKDLDLALRQLKHLDELLPRVAPDFTGPRWELDWLDWSQRYTNLLKRLRPD